MTLTRAGWPRPVIGGWPIPWVSPAENLAEMQGARLLAAASGAICAVCGCDYAEDEVAFALVKESELPESPDGMEVQAMDGAIMHERCLRLAVGRCPRLRALRDAGELQLVRTTGNIADARLTEDGSLVGVLAEGDFEALHLEAFLAKE